MTDHAETKLILFSQPDESTVLSDFDRANQEIGPRQENRHEWGVTMKTIYIISCLSICLLSQSFAATESLDVKLGIKHPAVDEASYNSKYSIALVSIVPVQSTFEEIAQIVGSVIDSFENDKRPLKFIVLYAFDETKRSLGQIEIDVSNEDKMECIKMYIKIPPDELAAEQSTRGKQWRKLMRNISNSSINKYTRAQKEITFAAMWELIKAGINMEDVRVSSYTQNGKTSYDLATYYQDRTTTGDTQSLIKVVATGIAVAKKLGVYIRRVEAKPVWAGTSDSRSSVQVNLNGYKDVQELLISGKRGGELSPTEKERYEEWVSTWKVQVFDKDWKATLK